MDCAHCGTRYCGACLYGEAGKMETLAKCAHCLKPPGAVPTKERKSWGGGPGSPTSRHSSAISKENVIDSAEPLHLAFLCYASFGHPNIMEEMDGRLLQKWFREAKLFDRSFIPTDLDLIHTKATHFCLRSGEPMHKAHVRSSGLKRRLTFPQFLAMLPEIAERKGWTTQELSEVLDKKLPKANVTQVPTEAEKQLSARLNIRNPNRPSRERSMSREPSRSGNSTARVRSTSVISGDSRSPSITITTRTTEYPTPFTARQSYTNTTRRSLPLQFSPGIIHSGRQLPGHPPRQSLRPLMKATFQPPPRNIMSNAVPDQGAMYMGRRSLPWHVSMDNSMTSQSVQAPPPPLRRETSHTIISSKCASCGRFRGHTASCFLLGQPLVY